MSEPAQPDKKYIVADILKKREHQRSVNEDRVEKLKQKRIERKQKKDDFVHPEKFITAYRKQQKAFSYFKKKSQRLSTAGEDVTEVNTNLHDIPLNRTLLVVRIRGHQDISDVQKNILQSLRLKRINTAVFLKSNQKIIKMLKRVENYVAFGIPSRQTVNLLIQKRGHTQKDSELVPLTSNQIIEDKLGDKNIICLEDLVEEVVKCGANVIPAATFLRYRDLFYIQSPFRLNHPKSALKSGRIKKPITKGGEWGYREEKINQLVEQMI